MTKITTSSAVALIAAALCHSFAVTGAAAWKETKACVVEDDCELNQWCKSKSIKDLCESQSVGDCPTKTGACKLVSPQRFDDDDVRAPRDDESRVPLTELQCPRYMCKCDAYHATTSTSTKRSYTAPGHVPHLRNLLEGEAAPEAVAAPEAAVDPRRSLVENQMKRSLFQAGGNAQWPTRALTDVIDFDDIPELIPSAYGSDGSKESRVWYDLKTGVCNWPCKKCPCICM